MRLGTLISLLCFIQLNVVSNPDPGTVLFEDKLDGKANQAWKTAPETYFTNPQGETFYHFSSTQEKLPTVGAQAGDETWNNCRIEFEVRCANDGGGFVGLDFYVSNDSSRASNVGFYMPKKDGKIAFEEAGRWNDNTSWKHYPYSQIQIDYKKDQWIKLRLDADREIANLYVNGDPDPVYTMYDLPTSRGGIRFWIYHMSVYIRNLRITTIPPDSVKPVLEDSWKQVSQQNIIKKWEISHKYPADLGTETLPEELKNKSWRTIASDRRGIVNLAAEFMDDISKGIVFARNTVKSEDEIVKKSWVSYTDRMTMWCNGKQVFKGQPRGFYDPGRSPEDGFGRLIPDQFEVALPLKKGDNEILIRSEVTEPLWGWAYWMRLE